MLCYVMFIPIPVQGLCVRCLRDLLRNHEFTRNLHLDEYNCKKETKFPSPTFLWPSRKTLPRKSSFHSMIWSVQPSKMKKFVPIPPPSPYWARFNRFDDSSSPCHYQIFLDIRLDPMKHHLSAPNVVETLGVIEVKLLLTGVSGIFTLFTIGDG